MMQKGIREKPLKNVAQFIPPTQPTMVSRLPEDRDCWLLEPKLDGYGVIAVKSSSHANKGAVSGGPKCDAHRAERDFGENRDLQH